MGNTLTLGGRKHILVSKMATSSVILFKTGYSFISTPVTLGSGSGKAGAVEEARVGPLPSFAVHGTVALQPSDDSVQLLSLGRRQEEDLQLLLPEGEDFSIPAFLAANTNTLINLTLAEDAKNTRSSRHQGKVRWVQPPGNATRLALLQLTHGQGKRDLLLDTAKIVNIERVQDNEERDVNLVARFKRKEEGKKAPTATLSYLTRGLTWAPTYSMILNKEKMTLHLEGNATILCDLPFFDGEPIGSVSMVAGQPKVVLEQLSDPLADGSGAMDFIVELENALREDSPVIRSRHRGPRAVKMMACSRSFSARSANDREGFDSYEVNQTEEGIKGGEVVEDFFHYQLESVPLQHKQPVKMPFIKECREVKYEDVYFLDLDQRVRMMKSGEDEENSVEVKHAISFRNPTGQPLTGGPVSILARQNEEVESKFMVQAMMKFTGPEKPIIVEITRAMDVQATYSVETCKEKKTELWSAAVSWTGAGKKYVDVVTKKGKLTIKNPKATAIKCKIEHALQGHLEKSKPAVKEVTERPSHGQELNPTSKLLWELEVPAEGSAELSIEYGVKMWK